MTRLLLLSSLLSGCVFLLGPRTPGEQGHALLGHADYLGHLDGKLAQADKKPAASVSGAVLDFRGIAADLFCVSYDTDLQWFPGADAKEDVIAKRLAKAKTLNLVFAAPSTIDESATATFPPAPSTPLEARIIDKGATSEPDSRDPYNRSMDTFEIDSTSFLCAPAPKVTPAAKYITAVLYAPNERPEIFIWKIDGTAEAFDPAAVTAPAPGDDAAPDKAAPAAAPVPTDDLVTVATHDGRFTIFLKLLAASSYAGKLGSTDAYTAFLPTDDALKAHRADVDTWLKDKKQLDRVVGAQVCGGALSKAKLQEGVASSDHYLSLQNGLGNYLRVRADGDAFKIGKDVHVALPELSASNGVIYPVDGLVQCDRRGNCP
ncbi:MAG TPA: fasciclin domain-containing protein [Kofleriaceae bacterium]|jgi:uncharacterized surface protein with fasciclin (FAS1) repeats